MLVVQLRWKVCCMCHCWWIYVLVFIFLFMLCNIGTLDCNGVSWRPVQSVHRGSLLGLSNRCLVYLLKEEDVLLVLLPNSPWSRLLPRVNSSWFQIKTFASSLSWPVDMFSCLKTQYFKNRQDSRRYASRSSLHALFFCVCVCVHFGTHYSTRVRVIFREVLMFAGCT